MITTTNELQEALARLSLEGGDCLDLEVKTFSEYSAKSLGPTLCAFGNLPGGGSVLLGVNERGDAPVVGLDNAHDTAERATNQARSGLSVPLTVDVRVLTLDSREVAALNVSEAPVNQKPCTWNGKAYIRQYDGDYTMSLQEQQQLLRRHNRPRDDREPVPGTSRADLDDQAVKDFAISVRQTTPALRACTDAEILLRLNAITDSGEATVAGLYALGTYPQQHLPHLSLTAAIVSKQAEAKGERGRNRKDFTGALPQILDGAVEWVSQNIGSTLVVSRDGRSQTTFAIPLVAVREVVANALVHRDLSEATAGRAVELRLTDSGLVLTSPGGLWGLSVDQLGTPDGKSAVNEFLYTICRHVGGAGDRVIEAMGTGIRATRQALAEAGLEPPRFTDNGVRFTVRFPNHALHTYKDLAWLGSLDLAGLSAGQKEALLRMRSGAELSNSDYRQFAQVDSTTARAELGELVRRGLAERIGKHRGTRYRFPTA
ncbi:Divergent AAA domain [Actinomyces bovis]|uniref:Divergent AAA domain n=1 Tax=Actinomyces bovis TaxID=1658 RepID=A0ABY1VST9_9ACTO|nr:RNA-binding domain-containing protein [Actinomyces bovis]SPT55024.1 Divergent AAA domain [Actinomyces bovis]VEG56168.1 Divergent AAA domain [Actinomyces israelii]